ncbi:MAG: hypothetical protein WCG75_09670 [Armatimonadota bacterium]
METKAFTTRLPLQVCEAMATYVAEKKASSVNQFVTEAVEEKLARDRQDELRKGFALLGEDFDSSEVEPWIDLQREAAKHIDD